MSLNPMHQFEVYKIGPEIILGGINLSFTNAPIHILMGEDDNWVPADACVDLVESANLSNLNITMYPNSHHSFDRNQELIHVEDAYDMVVKLRNRIAKKHYETARLYLKMKKFDSSFYYLNMVLSDYYDTKYYDEAIITYIFTFIIW